MHNNQFLTIEVKIKSDALPFWRYCKYQLMEEEFRRKKIVYHKPLVYFEALFSY